MVASASSACVTLSACLSEAEWEDKVAFLCESSEADRDESWDEREERDDAADVDEDESVPSADSSDDRREMRDESESAGRVGASYVFAGRLWVIN